MEGVDTKPIYSDGRCVRTNFLLTDARYTAVIPPRVHIQVGRTALAARLPQITENLRRRHSDQCAFTVEQLILGLFAIEAADTVTILRDRSGPPSIAIGYHNSLWLTEAELERSLCQADWSFVTLLAASESA